MLKNNYRVISSNTSLKHIRLLALPDIQCHTTTVIIGSELTAYSSWNDFGKAQRYAKHVPWLRNVYGAQSNAALLA